MSESCSPGIVQTVRNDPEAGNKEREQSGGKGVKGIQGSSRNREKKQNISAEQNGLVQEGYQNKTKCLFYKLYKV